MTLGGGDSSFNCVEDRALEGSTPSATHPVGMESPSPFHFTLFSACKDCPFPGLVGVQTILAGNAENPQAKRGVVTEAAAQERV